MNPFQLMALAVGVIGAILLTDKKVANSVPTDDNPTGGETEGGENEQVISTGDSGGSSGSDPVGTVDKTGLGLDS